jgi:hypothetical protein
MARVKRKNWPPCKPILYHDINAEVPVWIWHRTRAPSPFSPSAPTTTITTTFLLHHLACLQTIHSTYTRPPTCPQLCQ